MTAAEMPRIAVPVSHGSGEDSRPIWLGQRPAAYRILVGAAVPDVTGANHAGHMDLPGQGLDRGGAVPAVILSRRHG
jgi:hypothetical protein